MSFQSLGAQFAADNRPKANAKYWPGGSGWEQGKIDIEVTLGESEIETEGESVRVIGHTFDFIINVDQLATLTEFRSYDKHERNMPLRGEVIEFNGRTFEVVEPEGKQCWEFHDRFQKSIRVHTVEIGRYVASS